MGGYGTTLTASDFAKQQKQGNKAVQVDVRLTPHGRAESARVPTIRKCIPFKAIWFPIESTCAPLHPGGSRAADSPGTLAKLSKHLSDATTSRDLFGTVRGKCRRCEATGGCPGGAVQQARPKLETDRFQLLIVKKDNSAFKFQLEPGF